MEEDNKLVKRKKTQKKSEGNSWIIWVTLISFFLSALLILITSKTLEDVSILTALILLFIIIFIGIIFDTIGISVASANIATFHSMASNKMYGAKKAIWLVKNADKVSSFCNDVIGDICGVISGASSALIVISLVISSNNNTISWPNLIMSGLVASLTVGGKAIGKKIALNNGNSIVYKVGIVIQFLIGKRENNDR